MGLVLNEFSLENLGFFFVILGVLSVLWMEIRYGKALLYFAGFVIAWSRNFKCLFAAKCWEYQWLILVYGSGILVICYAWSALFQSEIFVLKLNVPNKIIYFCLLGVTVEVLCLSSDFSVFSAIKALNSLGFKNKICFLEQMILDV